MRHKSFIAAVTALLVLAPAAAANTPVDAASDHAALTAYDRYLQSAAARVPDWRRDDDAYVASISAECQKVLTSLRALPAGTVNQTALFNFGQEVSGDLALVGARADRFEWTTLTQAVSRLPWSTPQTGAVVRRFLTTQTRLFRFAPSHLCDDAHALSDLSGTQTPPGTAHWLTGFVRDGGAQERAQVAFEAMLRRLQTPADSRLLRDMGPLERHLGVRLETVSTRETAKLLSALGATGLGIRGANRSPARTR